MDRKIYKRERKAILNAYPNLTIRAGSVFDLVYRSPLVESISGSSSMMSPSEIQGGAPWAVVEGVRLG